MEYAEKINRIHELTADKLLSYLEGNPTKVTTKKTIVEFVGGNTDKAIPKSGVISEEIIKPSPMIWERILTTKGTYSDNSNEQKNSLESFNKELLRYYNPYDRSLYTDVFRMNYDAYSKAFRIVLNQGGTRSSKTYSIAQMIFLICLQNEGLIISIVGKTLPHLKSDAMRTMFDIIDSAGLYSKENHNKSDGTYHLNGNMIEFFSVENEKKVRGRERDILWTPEANLLNKMDFQQLLMRTKKMIFADYNPSDEYHWIYDEVQTRKDCCFLKSTYKDNTFLEKELVNEIEMLQDTDAQLWNIYGLGERGTSTNTIYTNWDLYEQDPDNYDEIIYGLDFGYNNPSALVQLMIKENDVYIRELIYETRLTNNDLIERIKTLDIGDINYVFADAAEPARIQEIRNSNVNIYEAIKEVKNGIDYVKRFKLHIHKNSDNLIKEIKHYKWKEDKNGNILEEPVKFKDHAIDAVRYALFTYAKKFMNIQFRGVKL